MPAKRFGTTSALFTMLFSRPCYCERVVQGKRGLLAKNKNKKKKGGAVFFFTCRVVIGGT